MTAIGTTAGNRRGRLEYFHSRKERCGKPVFSASFCVGSESGREWVSEGPGQGQEAGERLFPGPVGPGIAMSLGDYVRCAFHNF